MGNAKRQRTEDLQRWARERVLAFEADEITAAHNFVRLVKSGVVVPNSVPTNDLGERE